MPISIDEFESQHPEPRETNADRVIRFPAQHPDKSYKAIEIAGATEVNEDSIHPVLNRLKERELVSHKKPYWASGDLEAVRDAMLVSSTVEYLHERLGRKAGRSG